MGDSFSFFNAGKSTIIFALLRVQIANMSSFITTIQSKLGYSSKKALLLGAGFVTRPTVQILADAGVEVTVACRTLESAKKLCEGIKNTRPISLDVTKDADLDAAVENSDLVISLIPYTFHATVIKSAIRKKKNVVTTSYVSDAMKELEQQAIEAGIIVLNEIGLDPGIDHLYAVKTIDDTHKAGGKINSFISYCGGLPAPSSADNPLGYKFSWSSRGVLLALLNSAKLYQGGELVSIEGKELMSHAKPYFINPAFGFVAYPNRDSTSFREKYNIPEAGTVIRGTLRYQGFPQFIKCLVEIGFLDESSKDYLKPGSNATWAEVTQKAVGANSSSEEALVAKVLSLADIPDISEQQRIIQGLRWIGLFSSSEKVEARGNLLDTLCATLEKKMAYAKGEKDMVMLQHKFEIENKDGSKVTRTSTLLDYGAPFHTGEGPSSMAKLVGVPCGIAVQLVLDGKINTPGVLAPYNRELVDILIAEVEKEGITMVEKDL